MCILARGGLRVAAGAVVRDVVDVVEGGVRRARVVSRRRGFVIAVPAGRQGDKDETAGQRGPHELSATEG